MLDKEQIRQSALFKQLTEQEREFVLAFVGSQGDPIAAAKAAYRCQTTASARTYARQVLQRPIIAALLSPSSEELSLDEALRILSSIARNERNHSKTRIDAISEFSTLRGWRSRQSQQTSADREVDQIIADLDSE